MGFVKSSWFIESAEVNAIIEAKNELSSIKKTYSY